MLFQVVLALMQEKHGDNGERNVLPMPPQPIPNQAHPKNDPGPHEDWRYRLFLHSLQQGRQQLLFGLMMPSIEPHGRGAV